MLCRAQTAASGAPQGGESHGATPGPGSVREAKPGVEEVSEAPWCCGVVCLERLEEVGGNWESSSSALLLHLAFFFFFMGAVFVYS